MNLSIHEQQSVIASLQFSFFGPKLYVNSNPVDVVDTTPVMGLRPYLSRKRNNPLKIHVQHLSSLPKVFQLEDSVTRILIPIPTAVDITKRSKVKTSTMSPLPRSSPKTNSQL
uniref:Uncharacterized protein n=1 Tax=Lactuca sativa TaxID=4236 RepID=A0A9R1WQR7_LACSA|nr:hypothetical protein LSAT_V11C900504710 [Lactuca sativa]